MKMNKLYLYILTSLLMVYGSAHRYDECTDDNCYYYDYEEDPRNDFLDLLEEVEDTANDTFDLPDWDIVLAFRKGSFYYNYDGGDYTCICPLKRTDKHVLATYHDYIISSYRYDWYIPKTNLTGQFEVSAEMFYSIYLLNGSTHLPKIEGINGTYFHIFYWWFDGLPLKWLERIPNAVFEGAVSLPLKPFIERTLAAAYQEAIHNLYNGTKRHTKAHMKIPRPQHISEFMKHRKPRRFYHHRKHV